MSLSLLKNSQFVTCSRRDELDLLIVQHPHFYAELVLQGAQLISFCPTGQTNWLWLSAQAEYKQGQSVRGGVPICWPWFGNLALNPEAVKLSVADSTAHLAHGFARIQPWSLMHCDETHDSLTLKLVMDNDPKLYQANLSLSAEFIFHKDRLSVRLHCQNLGSQTQSFSQALHSYFPTEDIQQTAILGLDNHTYIDTLTGWNEKIQQQELRFTQETDRIYYGNAPLQLLSPNRQFELHSEGSNSLVIWNPWCDKSLRLSQFSALDYQQMLCVETANALADIVQLAPQETHCLGFTLQSIHHAK